MRVGSVFSGIGGLDLAFLQSGHTVQWAIEKDNACCETYSYNFRNTLLFHEDVRRLQAKYLQKVDCLIAGFPCQSFSVAGTERGFSDSRGKLFFEIVRLAYYLKPRFLLLENVANLIVHDDCRSLLTIHRELSKIGYIVKYKTMRSSEYGNIPQIRDRAYIVAFLRENDCRRFSFPEPVPLTVGIDAIINRKERKHPFYYYKESDSFFSYIKNVVVSKDCIYRVYHDSVKEVRNHMCPTLTASMGNLENQVPLLLDDYGIRKLTIRECLDFQGFPKEYSFPHTIQISDAYKQIGNSVTVSVVKRLADVLFTL